MNAVYFSLTSIVVYLFLVITLIVGILSSKRIKDIKEYALANKMFGTGVLTISTTATYLGANVIYQQKKHLTYGLITGLAFIGTVINLMLSSKFIVPNLAKFRNCLTLGDLIKEMYGDVAGIIVGGLGTIFSISLMGAQLVALSHVCNLFLGWDTKFSIISVGLILGLYSAKGGIKAITITDLLHFIMIIFVIPLIANIAVNRAGGLMNIFASLPKYKLSITSNPQLTKYLSNFLVWSIIPAMIVNPAIIQRILMAKYNKHAQIMMFNTGALTLFVRALVTITCLAVLVIEPNIAPTYAGGFLYVINNFLSPSLKILCTLGILSLLISTIDSVLNAGAVLFTHNFATPILSKQGININQVKVARYASIAMVILCIFISLKNVKEIRVLLSISMSGLPLMVIPPFILGIFGLRSSSSVFILTTVVNTLVFVYLSIYVIDYSKDFIQQPILATTSLITFCLIHLAKHGRFSFKKDINYKDSVTLNLKNIISNIPSRLSNYLKFQMDKYEANVSMFSIFMSISYLMPFFISQADIIMHVMLLRFIGLMFCIGLMLYPYWNKKYYQRYFHFYWNISLIYCLPFSSTVFYMLNNGSIIATINVAFSILLLVVLVDWKSFIILSLSGLSMGFVIVKSLILLPQLSFSDEFNLMYTGLYSLCVGLTFVKRKEKKFDEYVIKSEYLKELCHEMNNTLINVIKSQEEIREGLGNYYMEYIDDLSGIDRVEKHFNDAVRHIFKKTRSKLRKRLADRMIYNNYD